MLTQNWLANWYASDNICLDIGGDFGSCTCGYDSILTLEAYGKPMCQCALGFSLLDVNKRNIGFKQDDLSYISESYKIGSLISEDQFEFLEMEYVVWPLADCELLQPTIESACKISCVHNCYCAVAIFQQPEYYNGIGRCWKKKLPLSHGRPNSSAVERKVLFKKLKLNSSSQSPDLGK